MKKRKMVLGILTLTALAAASLSGLAVAAEKGAAKTQTVKGELVDSRCYLTMGKRGSEHTKCAVACAKDGLPIGLVDAKGNYYTVVVQASQIADSAGLQAEVEGTVKGDSIIPTRLRVNKDGAWTEVKLPEQMM